MLSANAPGGPQAAPSTRGSISAVFGSPSRQRLGSQPAAAHQMRALPGHGTLGKCTPLPGRTCWVRWAARGNGYRGEMYSRLRALPQQPGVRQQQWLQGAGGQRGSPARRISSTISHGSASAPQYRKYHTPGQRGGPPIPSQDPTAASAQRPAHSMGGRDSLLSVLVE